MSGGHFSRPNGFAVEGEPWTFKHSRDSEAPKGLCRAYRGKAELGKAPVALSPDERAHYGGWALALQAKHDREALQVLNSVSCKASAITGFLELSEY